MINPHPKQGDVVAFYPGLGQKPIEARVVCDRGFFRANIECDGVSYEHIYCGPDTSRVPRFEYPETEAVGFDPAAPIDTSKPLAARCDNPIASICEWMAAVTPTPAMAEALCMEEMGETLLGYKVTDGDVVDETQALVAQAMLGYADVLRRNPDLHVDYIDRDAVVDGHLDSAWVHLQAAAVLIGPENLSLAWSRLHKANVSDKKVDGKFVLDSTGKVTKPAGWVAPDYRDLIKEF